jgi:pantoate--beta-alanine ligase
MRVFDTVEAFRGACDELRRSSRRVGLVPTMGALHQGHASLLRCARHDGCAVALSIFVNPTQFGPNEDFTKYPRTLDNDLALAQAEGVELVFAPSAAEMYPAGESTRVAVEGLTSGMCGVSRPGHFDGVTTIVAKLFAATGPCLAYFGRKDYQQYRVVERMARDLMFPVHVVGCPIIRESDGLAMSSRNRYLSPDERIRALAIARGLSKAAAAFSAGLRAPGALLQLVRDSLKHSELHEDYVALREPVGLDPLQDVASLPDRVLLAVAAFCGKTRLIDNLVLGEEAAPNAAEVA